MGGAAGPPRRDAAREEGLEPGAQERGSGPQKRGGTGGGQGAVSTPSSASPIPAPTLPLPLPPPPQPGLGWPRGSPCIHLCWHCLLLAATTTCVSMEMGVLGKATFNGARPRGPASPGRDSERRGPGACFRIAIAVLGTRILLPQLPFLDLNLRG